MTDKTDQDMPGKSAGTIVEIEPSAIDKITDLARAPIAFSPRAFEPDPAAVNQNPYFGPQVVLVPDGYTAQDLTDKVTRFRAAPYRRRGTMTAQSMAAVIGWSQRFCDKDTSAAFLDMDKRALTVIANYHESGAPSIPDSINYEKPDPRAQWTDHRCHYAFPMSKTFLAWANENKTQMSVPEFGAMLADRTADLMQPTQAMRGLDIDAASTEWERAAIERLRLEPGTARFATVEELAAMGRSFSINVDAKFKLQHDRQSGKALIVQSEEHVDDAGAPVSIPRAFMIAVPVFERGDVYPLFCEFNYRMRGQAAALSYRIADPERAVDDAVDRMMRAFMAAQPDLPIFEGTPEPVPSY